jgi:hypothetical protein
MMNAVVTAIIFIIFVPLTRVERLIDGAVPAVEGIQVVF